MCGLIAYIGEDQSPPLSQQVRRGLNHMLHRGPDGEGFWAGEGCILGHRRLAIIDLDERAAQPMHSRCGRYTIVFNGEIYNYIELAADLRAKGVELHTTSDTEVIVELFARHGAAALSFLRGMFALVIWDRQIHRAFIARDAYGIKPLYLSRCQGGWLIASQVQALRATGLTNDDPDPTGQAGFWLLGSVPEPHTWYRDIQSLRAGHLAWIENGQCGIQTPWHDIGSAWRDAGVAPTATSEGIAERVQLALRSSVRAHLVADVPVGVFLSGGIDSSVLAALMAEHGSGEIQGITLAYDEFGGTANDEAPVAAAVARHYGIHHHVRRVSQGEFAADLPRILCAMDQPSIDGINTWYASKAAAELGLKVVISGVGGDELFQGYSSFAQLPQLVDRWRQADRVPGLRGLAQLACSAQAALTRNGRWRHAPAWLLSIPGAWWLRRGLFGPQDLVQLMGKELAKEALGDFSPDTWIAAMCGPICDDARLALGHIESTTYLRNQLLRDSDWASMDHSVELRTPLVDGWLLRELQQDLPHFRAFPGKSLLASAPARPLPSAITQRPKTGFGIPVAKWLGDMGIAGRGRGPSQIWAKHVAGAYGHLAP